MSADTEYVTLLNHAIHLHIDISMFPKIWAVFYSPGHAKPQAGTCTIFTGRV